MRKRVLKNATLQFPATFMKRRFRCSVNKSKFLPFLIFSVFELGMGTLGGASADNGQEVLNERVYDYFQKRSDKEKVEVTRGRPYRLNDQAHVEQKN